MFEGITNFFKRIGKKDQLEASSKDTAKEIVENDLNQSETTDYDKNDEVVVMSNDYFEELERK